MKAAMALIPQPAGALHRVRLKACLCAKAFWCALLMALQITLLTALLAGVDAGALAQAQAAVAPPTAVVVWDFDNQSPNAAQSAATADFLKRSLSENLTVSLLQVAGLQIGRAHV